MKNSRRPLGLSLDIRQAEKIFEDESEQQESKSFTGLKNAGEYSFKCTLSSKFNLQNQNQISQHHSNNNDITLSHGEQTDISAASPDVTENLSVVERRLDGSVVALGRSPHKESTSYDLSQIDSNIYISSWRTAQQLELLKEVGITHVINLIAHKQEKPAPKLSAQTFQTSALDCSFREPSFKEENRGSFGSAGLLIQEATQAEGSASNFSLSAQLQSRTLQASSHFPASEQQPSRNILPQLSTENNIKIKEQLEGAPQAQLDHNSLSCTNKNHFNKIETQHNKRIYQNIQEGKSKKHLLFNGSSFSQAQQQLLCPYDNISEYSGSQLESEAARLSNSLVSPEIQKHSAGQSPYLDPEHSSLKKSQHQQQQQQQQQQVPRNLQLPHHAKKPSNGQAPASNRSAQQPKQEQKQLYHHKTNSMISSGGGKPHNLSRNNRGVQPILSSNSVKSHKPHSNLQVPIKNQNKIQNQKTVGTKSSYFKWGAPNQLSEHNGKKQLASQQSQNSQKEQCDTCSSVVSNVDCISEPSFKIIQMLQDQLSIKPQPTQISSGDSDRVILPLALPQCPREIEYLRLQMRDQADCDITYYVYQSIDFIQQALASSKGACKILIHCQQGNSRSAAVAAAHLMFHKKMTDREAIDFIRSKRGSIDPNIGFVGQLMVLNRKFQALRNKSDYQNKNNNNSDSINTTSQQINLQQLQQVQLSQSSPYKFKNYISAASNARQLLQNRNQQVNSSLSLLQELNPSHSSRATKLTHRGEANSSIKSNSTLFASSATNRVSRLGGAREREQRVLAPTNGQRKSGFGEKRTSAQQTISGAKTPAQSGQDLFGPKLFTFCFKQRKIVSKNIAGAQKKEDSLQKSIQMLQDCSQLSLLVTEQFSILQCLFTAETSNNSSGEGYQFGIVLLLSLAKLLQKFENKSHICYILKSVKQKMLVNEQQSPLENIQMTKIEDIRNLNLSFDFQATATAAVSYSKAFATPDQSKMNAKRPLINVSQLQSRQKSSLKVNLAQSSVQSLTQKMSKLMIGSPGKVVTQKLLSRDSDRSVKSRATNSSHLGKHKHSQTSVYSSILNVRAQVKNNQAMKQSHTIKEKRSNKMSYLLYKDCEEIGFEDINLRSQINNARNSEHQKTQHKTQVSTNLNISFINTENSEQENSVKNIFAGNGREGGDRFFQPSTLQFFQPLRPALSLQNPSYPQEQLNGEGSGNQNQERLEGSFGYGCFGETFGEGDPNGVLDEEVSLINSNSHPNNLNRTISMSDLLRLDQAQVLLKSQEQNPSRNLCSPGI